MIINKMEKIVSELVKLIVEVVAKMALLWEYCLGDTYNKTL